MVISAARACAGSEDPRLLLWLSVDFTPAKPAVLAQPDLHRPSTLNPIATLRDFAAQLTRNQQKGPNLEESGALFQVVHYSVHQLFLHCGSP